MCVATIFMLSLAVAGVALAAGDVNPHNFKDKKLCAHCHKSVPALKHDPVSTCTKCHMDNVSDHPVAKHPIGVAPVKAMLTAPMRLSKGGELVCYTCHDHHGERSFSHMLRVDMGRVCTACHKGH